MKFLFEFFPPLSGIYFNSISFLQNSAKFYINASLKNGNLVVPLKKGGGAMAPPAPPLTTPLIEKILETLHLPSQMPVCSKDLQFLGYSL